jgi:formylglycine-generating enzyme required for sulfatase activity
MVFIPGGSFRMGSDDHYPEEAPAGRVKVDGVWIDRAPVTNRQFARLAMATGRAREEGSHDPGQANAKIPHKVTKGGSRLRAPDYRRRYRLSAREEAVDTSTSHLGFRCARRTSAAE